MISPTALMTTGWARDVQAVTASIITVKNKLFRRVAPDLQRN
jgi:hypothetical protein